MFLCHLDVRVPTEEGFQIFPSKVPNHTTSYASLGSRRWFAKSPSVGHVKKFHTCCCCHYEMKRRGNIRRARFIFTRRSCFWATAVKRHCHCKQGLHAQEKLALYRKDIEAMLGESSALETWEAKVVKIMIRNWFCSISWRYNEKEGWSWHCHESRKKEEQCLELPEVKLLQGWG